MARTVMCLSRNTAPRRPGFTRLPNGLDLHAPPVETARPLLPRRVPLSAIALLLFALAGWAGLLAWTRLDPASPCATCLAEPGQL
ncbi:hypothetical protein [Methylobacterium frigidaeris]|uniref:Uncharacterized protein n=1 Tax=Methylobacterium frigidaeris TaxID=2038277 RepID=A0AA37HEY3_9HYPH|nr:hypothetical protein [Methylobacterium frigidaeris]PIK68961.1 hypothetical protein CS379_32295 [Methylobacterium frigidaeris]GJD64786.1 hypothetical protein MPEAHAMD_4971 [Methylobacterium frigidaeris]